MTAVELDQWRAVSLSAACPAAAVDEGTLFVNYLGHAFAVDLGTGKMRWRSGSFHNLDIAAVQNQGMGVDPGRFAVLARGGRAWFLERDLKDQNYSATFFLTCRRADGGDVVWRSTDLTDFEGLDLIGRPTLVNGKLLIAAKDQSNGQGTPQFSVLAIRPLDGEILWRTDLGITRSSNSYYYYNVEAGAPAPVPLPIGDGLRRDPPRRARPARPRVRGARLGLRLRDGGRPGPGGAIFSSSSTT